LDEDAWRAAEQHRNRLATAIMVKDAPLIIGSAKELAECVARVVGTVKGTITPCNADFAEVVNGAHIALDRQAGPGITQASDIRAIAQNAKKIALSVKDVRNDFGTGHGQAEVKSVADEMVQLVVAGSRSSGMSRSRSRLLRGFAMSELAQSSKHRWGNFPATYDAHDLKISQYHVMADWERPYMERLAEIAASKGATVLEVSYGMIGYWQDVTPLLAAASIDGILFDTFPVFSPEMAGTHMSSSKRRTAFSSREAC
jgi:hypothetical protein